MAIYYVDLDIPSNPGFLPDDENQPMGALEFQKPLDPTNPDYPTYYDKDYLLKGMTVYSGIDRVNFLCSCQPWDASQYGPWRIRCESMSNGIFIYAQISGGIISMDGSGLFYSGVSNSGVIINTYNCVLHTEGMMLCTNYYSFNRGPTHWNLFGCTLIANQLRMSGDKANFYLTDCVLSSALPFSGAGGSTGNLLVNNSVFNSSQADVEGMTNETTGTIDINNAQFDWSSPVWPTWSAPIEQWDANTLSFGIQTPPQPGNPLYVGYETGLTGNVRLGIGSFVFHVPPYSELDIGRTIDISGSHISVVSTVSGSRIIGDISGDPLFDNESKWSMISVEYRHSSGQSLTIIHRNTGSGWEGSGVFSKNCQPGTWVKTRMVIHDKMGTSKILTDFEDEDLTVNQI